MTEAKLIGQIIRNCQGPRTLLFRNAAGRLKVGDRWMATGLCRGSSDIIGIHERDGRGLFVALEVKTPNTRTTEEQASFITQITARGGIAGIVTSVEEARRLLGIETN